MERILARYSPSLYAILRIVTGLLFMMHGTQKLFGWPGAKARATALPQLIAGVIEVGGGALIALGLLVSWTAFLASGLMAVAYWWRHAPDGFWPIVNRGELAVVYCFLFLYIASHGPGIWSLGKRRRT
jgi:putative oxidoreductase